MQFLLIIPIAVIIYMWHRSNSSLPPLPEYPPIFTNNLYSHESSNTDIFFDNSPWDDDDDLTDPAKSYLPGNIYHHDDDYLNSSNNDSYNSSFTDDMLDPGKDYLPYNIYHHDED